MSEKPHARGQHRQLRHIVVEPILKVQPESEAYRRHPYGEADILKRWPSGYSLVGSFCRRVIFRGGTSHYRRWLSTVSRCG
jgi:hypothetical protein